MMQINGTKIKILVGVLIISVLFFAIITYYTQVYYPNTREGKYERAEKLMVEENYSEAIEIFEELGGAYPATSYESSYELLNYCKEKVEKAEMDERYDEVTTLKDKGKYLEAIEILEELGTYNDSDEQILEMIENLETRKEYYNSKEIGDTILFGKYEIDGDENNGKEGIEWIVLDKDEGNALLISKCVLDMLPYNAIHGEITWEKSTIRQWLNKDFIMMAFDENEQLRIRETNVKAEDNRKADAGNDTKDYLFLLSISEVEKYNLTDEGEMIKATEYARSMGVRETFDEASWLLRSPGFTQYYAAYVLPAGLTVYGSNIDLVGCGVSDRGYGIRPAMWVSFEN